MEKHLKALEIEHAINNFAGLDNKFITADDLILNFKPTLAEGLNSLKLRSLITEKEEITLNNICNDCEDNLKDALDEMCDAESIDLLIERLKHLSKKYIEEADNEN